MQIIKNNVYSYLGVSSTHEFDNKFILNQINQEAKHGIYRDCLGFKDFANFDGVRFAYKGVRIVAFKLKEAINVDQLIGKQYFDYNGKIELRWLNLSYETFEVKCKNLFITKTHN